MNERIRELKKQATKIVETTDHCTGVSESKIEVDLDKFAQLIVAECMSVAVNKDSGYIHPADVAGHMAAGRSTAAQMIREHFGVEE